MHIVSRATMFVVVSSWTFLAIFLMTITAT